MRPRWDCGSEVILRRVLSERQIWAAFGGNDVGVKDFPYIAVCIKKDKAFGQD